MEVSAEAKRVMVQALSKLYSSRTQRGGLRLHRSLLLTLVLRSARDIYHSARAACDSEEPLGPPAADPQQCPAEEAMETSGGRAETAVSVQEQPASRRESRDDKENESPAGAERQSRKRRGKTAAEPDFLPSKRARMDPSEERLPTRSGPGGCRGLRGTLASLPVSQAIAAF
ncbi:immediate early response gene 2 protein-like [Scleropages formosus]|uniref:Immediate early response 2a n=1 Tax=Scleropages formosus TaxID=113540 RepID=A0A8C9WGG9_SCLFO|nr:immediate early response gene 2 protein-like [Scleropages formosus]